MRLGQLPYLFLLLLVFPTAAQAKNPRTFLINIALAGSYHEENHFTDLDQQGFCPGTGNVEDVPFALSGHAKVTFENGKTKFENKNLTITNTTAEDWTNEIATVAQGDDCGKLVNFKCGGKVEQSPVETGNFAYAQDLGKKVLLGARLKHLVATFGQCPADDGYFPGNGVGSFVDAVRPYTEAAFVLKDKTFNAIKKGVTRRRTFKPLPQNIPDGYDVASCQHADFKVCTARLESFSHTITIKRTK